MARSSAGGRSLGERISDTDFKGNKIMHHEYIVANSLYLRIFTAYISIHFHSIITSGEKQELQVACKLVASHLTHGIPTFQCHLPISAGTACKAEID